MFSARALHPLCATVSRDRFCASAGSRRGSALNGGCQRWKPRSVLCLAKNDERDAAKRALEAAFSGKGDPLAQFDKPPPGGGGGRGGSGGWFSEDGRKKRKEALETFKAILFCVVGLALLSSWRTIFAFLVNAVFFIFRIPTGEPVASTAVSATDAVTARWKVPDDEDAS